jgi:hypothetical protein
MEDKTDGTRSAYGKNKTHIRFLLKKSETKNQDFRDLEVGGK